MGQGRPSGGRPQPNAGPQIVRWLITRCYCPRCAMEVFQPIAIDHATPEDWLELNQRIAIFRAAHPNHGLVISTEEPPECMTP